jgi:hypothetical protein
VGATTDNISERLGIELDELQYLAANAHRCWRKRPILIRKKWRPLLIPNHRLLAVQQRILKRVLESLSLHPAAACARGVGILAAAERHAKQPFFLHLDIARFFPSVSPFRVVGALNDAGITLPAARLLAALTTTRNQLPQGAPTSVFLANLVLRPLDRRLAGLARSAGLSYSRYVDDFGISGGRQLLELEPRLRSYITDHGWVIGLKGGVFGPRSRHSYLGLVLNAAPSVAPEYLDGLRLLASRIRQGKLTLSEKEAITFQGRLEFARSVNTKNAESVLRVLNPRRM